MVILADQSRFTLFPTGKYLLLYGEHESNLTIYKLFSNSVIYVRTIIVGAEMSWFSVVIRIVVLEEKH